MIVFAYEIFSVDRATDWNEFFDQHYPHVEQPKCESAPEVLEFGASSVERDASEDADELLDEEEFGDVCDDEIIHVSGFAQEKSGATPEKRCERVASKEAIEAIPSLPDAATGAASPPVSRQSRVLLKNLGKQRSIHTTSILVSPQSDRKFSSIFNHRQPTNSCAFNGSEERTTGSLRTPTGALSHQDSSYEVDEPYEVGEDLAERKRTLRSGEVIVDMKKEQFCFPGSKNDKASPNGRNQALSSVSFNAPRNSNALTHSTTPQRSSNGSNGVGQNESLAENSKSNHGSEITASARPAKAVSDATNIRARVNRAEARLRSSDFMMSANNASYV